jgi:glycerophosphoryl diester phosphodiesterase
MKTQIIAHRGGPGEGVMENSLEGFRYALRLHCGIETDLRTNGDEIFCLHDATLLKTVGVKKKLKDLKADELKKITLKNGEKIPTLVDLLFLVKQSGEKPILLLEVKESGFEEKLVSYLKQFKMQNNVFIISFHKNILKKIHALDPNLQTGYLFATSIQGKSPPAFCTAMLPNERLTNRGNLNKWRDLGKKIFVWTVNDPKKAKKLFGKVDGIVSDYPALLCLSLKQHSV